MVILNMTWGVRCDKCEEEWLQGGWVFCSTSLNLSKKVCNTVPAESCTVKLTACLKLQQTIATSYMKQLLPLRPPRKTYYFLMETTMCINEDRKIWMQHKFHIITWFTPHRKCIKTLSNWGKWDIRNPRCNLKRWNHTADWSERPMRRLDIYEATVAEARN